MHALVRFASRSLVLGLALGAGLAACEEIDLPPIETPPADDDGDRPRKNDCFQSMMYLVEGDTFTGLGGSTESFDTRGTVRDETGYSRNPLEPRAKCRADLDRVRGKYEGYARLYWNDELVQEAHLDHAFALGSEPVVLVHEAEDGTRVELHAFAKPECAFSSKAVMTRAEVEALER